MSPGNVIKGIQGFVTIPAEERFWSKVEKTDTCWLWQAGLSPRGYGKFTVGHKDWRAHRFAYELLVGPIGEGLTIDHLCLVKNCVNPAHMEVVTLSVNVKRGLVSGGHRSSMKTHCPKGHPYEGANLIVAKGGGRRCHACLIAKGQKTRSRPGFKEQRTAYFRVWRARKRDAVDVPVQAKLS